MIYHLKAIDQCISYDILVVLKEVMVWLEMENRYTPKLYLILQLSIHRLIRQMHGTTNVKVVGVVNCVMYWRGS